MSRRIAARALILAFGVASFCDEGAACVFRTPTEIGDNLSKRERAAREKRVALEQIRQRTLAAEAGLASGVDPAAALSAMLVPNIRPVVIERSPCGPASEIDYASGEEQPDEHWLARTPYEGRELEFRMIWRRESGGSFGAACNAEIRARFAAALQSRLDAGHLRASYVFLAPRGPDVTTLPPLRRMMAFADRSRMPPVLWTSPWRHDRQLARWLRRNPAGMALQRTIDEFWAAEGPRLADTELACPEAAAEVVAAKAKLVGLIEEHLARRRAAARR